MKGIPKRGPNPMEPLNRAIIAEAKVGALANVIFALSMRLRVIEGDNATTCAVLDDILRDARQWDPFPVGYESSSGEVSVPHPAQDWTPHVDPDQRVPLNRLTRDAIADEVKALRELIANPPPEWEDEA